MDKITSLVHHIMVDNKLSVMEQVTDRKNFYYSAMGANNTALWDDLSANLSEMAVLSRLGRKLYIGN